MPVQFPSCAAGDASGSPCSHRAAPQMRVAVRGAPRAGGDWLVQVAGHQHLRLPAPAEEEALLAGTQKKAPHTFDAHSGQRFGSSFLVKPVSRDAAIVQHLLEQRSEEEGGGAAHVEGRDGLGLSFALPFTPHCSAVRLSSSPLLGHKDASGPSPIRTEAPRARVDALELLRDLRRRYTSGVDADEGAGKAAISEEEGPYNARGLLLEGYFEACRRALKEAEANAFPATTGGGSPLGAEEADAIQHADNRLQGTSDNPPNEGKQAATKASASIVSKPWELCLANACAGMAAPCVLDVKIGRLHTAPGAPRAAEKEAKNEGTTAKLCGVRLTGMQYFAGSAAHVGGGGSGADETVGSADTHQSSEERANNSEFVAVGNVGNTPTQQPPHSSSSSASTPLASTNVTLHSIGGGLPKGWGRSLVPSEARLTEVLGAFFSACLFSDADGKKGRSGDANEDTNCSDGPSDAEIAALALRHFGEPRSEPNSAVPMGVYATGADNAYTVSSSAYRRVPLRSIAASALAQVGRMADAFATPHAAAVLREAFAFVSCSVLIVYDMAEALPNAFGGTEQCCTAVCAESGGSNSLLPPPPISNSGGYNKSSSLPSAHSASPSARVLLIDFDRCGPRSEHHPEAAAQFAASLRALEGHLRRVVEAQSAE